MHRKLTLEALESRLLLRGTLEAEVPAELPGEAAGEGAAMPDFVRTDVNPASATYNRGVSPRDYLQQVSAWYFGHAT